MYLKTNWMLGKLQQERSVQNVILKGFQSPAVQHMCRWDIYLFLKLLLNLQWQCHPGPARAVSRWCGISSRVHNQKVRYLYKKFFR